MSALGDRRLARGYALGRQQRRAEIAANRKKAKAAKRQTLRASAPLRVSVVSTSTHE